MSQDDQVPDIHMLTQPFLTEEGFVNPACMAELEQAIANMPETYDRLAHDREWNTPCITHFRDVTAALAYWMVHQFASEDHKSPAPPFHGPWLEFLINYLSVDIRPEFDNLGYAQLSLCQINKMCWDSLGEQQRFLDLNKETVLGSNWLDLSALLHNVCLTIRDNRRRDHEFLLEVEKETP